MKIIHIVKRLLMLNMASVKQMWIAATFFVAIVPLFAQQEGVFNHSMNNLLSLNPAYAGSREALTATLLHRQQWMGFEGAPVTSTFMVHSPVYNQKVNLGLSIVDDKVGTIHDRSFYVDYAYRFQLTKYSQLALGLKVGVKSLSADLSTLRLDQSGDELFAKDYSSGLYPNFGFGVYYSQDRFYLGLSSPRLIENSQKYRIGGTADDLYFEEQRQYFLISGAMFTLTNDIDFKPSIFLRATKGVTPVLDLTAMFIYQDKFQLGLLYRTTKEAGVLAGINLTPRLFMGYSYDWSFMSRVPKFNFGSSEVVLQYDFVYFGMKKIRSPRFF